MLGVLRHRNFALLWCGGLISSTGSQVLSLALPFFVYQRTHSVPATGAMFVAGTVPSILFGSVAGVFVDRWDRRRTMIVCDLTRAVLLLLLLTVRSREGLWVVYVVAFVEDVHLHAFRAGRRRSASPPGACMRPDRRQCPGEL